MKSTNLFPKGSLAPPAVILLIVLSSTMLTAQAQFPWPVTPFTQSHEITGNFCEYRSTTTPGHFHNGTDIPKADGSPVYSVNDGVVTALSRTGSNAYVRVQDKAYVHILPTPSLQVGDPVIASQTVLGTILPGMGHVHFTNGYVGSEVNSMLPNSGLTPLNDPWPPIIRFIKFYQNNTSFEFPTNEISGRVDIVVKVDEQNGDPGGSTSRLNNGTYKIGYKIYSADTSTIVYEPPNGGLRFKFDTKPSNSYVDIVYFQPLSSTTSHVYQVTNDVWQDNYWDTTTLPEDDYVVMAFTEDTRFNTDTAYATVTVVAADTDPPEQPVFKYVKEIPTGIRLGWYPVGAPDLVGYRLYFSFDNQNWSLFRDETVYTAGLTDTTIEQILNSDVYFRLSAVDNAPVPNESDFSDVYGMSNGPSFLGKVLIVDGFDRTDGGWTQPDHYFAFTHGTAIDANQFSFDTAPNESVIDSLINLGDYSAVIWFLGDESVADETFSPGEQALLKAYLESGGNLFVSGANIAWDLDPDGAGTATPDDEQFLHEYLKADFVSTAPGIVNVNGGDSSVFAGLSVTYGQIPYQADSADVIAPLGTGVKTAFKYDQSQAAAIQYEGTFGGTTTPGKVIYCAFPFETIAGENDRADVMGRVLNFFFGTTSIGDDGQKIGAIPTQFALLPNYPNPFNPSTTLEYHLPLTSEVTLEIYNLLGQRVRTLVAGPVTAGRHQVEWDGRSDNRETVSSGIYMVRFYARPAKGNGDITFTRKMLYLK